MLKYFDSAIVFAEIPDMITIAVDITNCPHHCEGCHSPYLQKDIGKILDNKAIDDIISKNAYTDCFCMMGGDSDHKAVADVAAYIHSRYPSIKVGMYSGDDALDPALVASLDYYKVGHYDAAAGPLNKETTNQRLYRISFGKPEDITSLFWKKH